MSPSSAQQVKGPQIIVALDYPALAPALALVSKLKPTQCRLKVGLELFNVCGPALVAELVDKGFDVFLDLKFHDIPNTVARACVAAAKLNVWMMNVHCLGGRRMMEAAYEAIDGAQGGDHRPLLIGVTVLTSHAPGELAELGLDEEAATLVPRLAHLAKDSGLDGVVCSPHEAAALRAELGPDFCLVTPGVRPVGSASGDQRRVMTPPEALNAGADYLVIGRPITAADDPLAALEKIRAGIGGD